VTNFPTEEEETHNGADILALSGTLTAALALIVSPGNKQETK